MPPYSGRRLWRGNRWSGILEHTFYNNMKISNFFAALAVGLAVVACNAQPKVEGAEEFMPTKAETDSVSYLVGINFGSFIKAYNFGDDLNYAEIVKGIKDFVSAEGDFRSPDFGKQFKYDPNSMNNAFNTYLEKRQNYVSLLNKDKEQKFLAENAKKAGVTQAESGLQYEIIEKGNDVVPGPVDTVWVRYKGTLIDGTVFDETPAEGEPVRIMLNQVVKGWQEGLQLIGEGGKIKLYVPSVLGYGEQGNQAIEPNSALIFDVELTKVGKVAAEQEK